MASKGINIVLYPRAYNKRGAPHLHSVRGVTADGEEINVKLRLDPEHQNKQHAPSIAEFARDDRRAKMACLAKEDNGPDRREGILLFSRAERDDSAKNPLPTYVARWAVVLAADADSPDPIIGLGRIAVRRQGSEMARLKKMLDAERSAGASDNSPAVRAILAKMEDPRSFNYPVVMYHPEALIGGFSDIDAFVHACVHEIERRTTSGCVGGVLIRVVDATGARSADRVRELYLRYRPALGANETASDLMAAWQQAPHTQLAEGEVFEAIPVTRINNGPKGSAYYGASPQYEGVCRTYLDDQNRPLVCQVAVRITYYEEQDVTLVSRVFPLSPPVGHPWRLGQPSSGTRAPDAGAYTTGVRLVGLQPGPIGRNESLMFEGSDAWHSDHSEQIHRPPTAVPQPSPNESVSGEFNQSPTPDEDESGRPSGYGDSTAASESKRRGDDDEQEPDRQKEAPPLSGIAAYAQRIIEKSKAPDQSSS